MVTFFPMGNERAFVHGPILNLFIAAGLGSFLLRENVQKQSPPVKKEGLSSLGEILLLVPHLLHPSDSLAI